LLAAVVGAVVSQTETVMLLGPALTVSAILFALGVAGAGAATRSTSRGLMLNAVNLRSPPAQQLGSRHVFVFFVMAVAAAEAAVGLAIILAIYRHRETVNLQDIHILKG
jgi:NADH-quinone oxidoreductase subunit K